MSKHTVLVSLSGGMDSATLLAELLAPPSLYSVVRAVGFAYGSKHGEYEREAAQSLCSYYGVPYQVISMEGVMRGFQSNLLKTGEDIPEGHYQEDTMSCTVVPGRNIIFTSVLAGLAWSLGVRCVMLGVHAGDHHIYPDCRPPFVHSMAEAVRHGTDGKVSLGAPYLHLDKAGIVKGGLALGVPYQLTRTCYKDQPVACGKCGSCQERLEAFALNGAVDPLEYETREILTKGGK